MSTHAEHLCPPPFIVLLWLILFSSVMIMISLAVKYKCKFTSIFPDKPLGKKSVIMFSWQKGSNISEKKIHSIARHYQFHSCHPPGFIILSSICLCVVLCMWTHQHRRHPLGTTVSYLLRLPENTCCLLSAHEQNKCRALVFFFLFCFFKTKKTTTLSCLKNVVDNQPLLYAGFVTGQVSQHR